MLFMFVLQFHAITVYFLRNIGYIGDHPFSTYTVFGKNNPWYEQLRVCISDQQEISDFRKICGHIEWMIPY